MIFTLRHGPVPVGRRMFDVSAEETIHLAEAVGPEHRTDARKSTWLLRTHRCELDLSSFLKDGGGGLMKVLAHPQPTDPTGLIGSDRRPATKILGS
jgi:hypothetical protein